MLAIIGLAVTSLLAGCSDMETGYAATKLERLESPLIRHISVDSGSVWVTMPRAA
jgi:hypothetical protein